MLLCTAGVQAQIQVYSTQQPVFEVHSFEVNERRSEMEYVQNSLTHKLSLSAVDSVIIQDRILVPVKKGKKYRLFDLLTKQNDKKLLVRKTTGVRYRGGYEAPFDRYEVIVLSEEDAVFRKRFTDEKSERSMQKFAGLLPVFQAHFPDCPALWHQFDPGYDGASVIGFLKRSNRVWCK